MFRHHARLMNEVPSAATALASWHSLGNPRGRCFGCTTFFGLAKRRGWSCSAAASVVGVRLAFLTPPPPAPQVVVVYIKRSRQSLFRPPPAVALVWNAGTRLSNRLRRVEKADPEPESPDEIKVRRMVDNAPCYRRCLSPTFPPHRLTRSGFSGEKGRE